VADSTKCRQNSNHITGFNPAACFTFYLPNEMQYVDVTSAQLWFYKEWDENDDELNQTFVLSELDHWDLGGSFEKNTVMAILETDIGGERSILIPFTNPPLLPSIRTSRIRIASRRDPPPRDFVTPFRCIALCQRIPRCTSGTISSENFIRMMRDNFITSRAIFAVISTQLALGRERKSLGKLESSVDLANRDHPTHVRIIAICSGIEIKRQANERTPQTANNFIHNFIARHIRPLSNFTLNLFSSTEGWVQTDLAFMVKKWIGRRRLSHAIQIACTTCSMNRDIAPVSVEQTLKPFLVIHTAPLPQKNRPKRNSNCLPEMKECCRDELYINFQDIGWSDWILHPSGYHAYFCRGSCSTAASLTNSGSHYNNVIRVSE